MKKVIVTGGCGFIGSHIVDELLSRGYLVKVISRPKCKMENLKHLKDRVEHVDCDVSNIEKMKNLMKDDNIYAILHLAALINVDQSLIKSNMFFNVNVGGTLNILEMARMINVEKFIYMSTCEVYGNIPKGKATEEHPTNPRSPYAASKFAAERYALSYAYSFNEPKIIVIRGFNQYGPRQSAGKFGAVIPKFITAALNGEKIKIFGDGKQTRDYVFVKDTVKGIVDALENDLPTGEIINLGTGVETSIKEVVESIADLSGMNRERIEFIDSRPGELIRSCGDSTKAKKLLGWEPKISFKEGIKITFEWYKEKLKK